MNIDLKSIGLKPLHKREPISHTTEYKTWSKIKSRCLCPTDAGYKNYGGRGITICDEWIDDPYKFIEDMGEKPEPKHLYGIERIDNNKGYSKDNCKWADKKEQANNRRSNIVVEYNGVSMTIEQWANALGIAGKTLRRRYHLGWSIEKMLTTPVRA